MSSKNKRKGTYSENKIVKLLNRAGIPSERMPLSGAMKRFPGDKLLELIETVPQVGTHLFNSLVTRLEQANSIIVKLANERMRKAS